MNANYSCVVVARLFLAGVFVSMLFGGVAHAGPVISYDFRGGGGPSNNPLGLDVGVLGPKLTVTQDGVTVDIVSKDKEEDLGPIAYLNRKRRGLGVAGPMAQAHIGSDEAVEFDFGAQEVVPLTVVILESGGIRGRFDLFVDGDWVERIRMHTGHNEEITHTFTTPVPSGSVLALAGHTGSFRIAGLTVEVVPEPEVLLLLLPGLIGLGFGRKAG